jgi:hypothetical protein
MCNNQKHEAAHHAHCAPAIVVPVYAILLEDLQRIGKDFSGQLKVDPI